MNQGSLKIVIYTIVFLFLTNISVSQKKGCAPVLYLDGYKTKDTIAIHKIDELNTLVMLDPCIGKPSHMVISYELTVVGGMHPRSFHGFGYALTGEMKKYMKVTPATKIYIDNVKRQNNNGQPADIAGLTLFIAKTSDALPLKFDTTGKIPGCDPIVFIGKYKSGDVLDNDKLNSSKVVWASNTCNTGKKYNGCIRDVSYKIVGYDIEASSGDQVLKLHSDGAEVPVELRSFFWKHKRSGTINIKNITAKYADGALVALPATTLSFVPAKVAGSTLSKGGSER